MASIIKADNIQKVSDGTNIIKKCGSTITLGSCGATIALACGASQTGFGQTYSATEFCTTVKTAPFTAVAGKGYFVNTCGGAVTVTLPASPTAGDIISLKDYKGTWNTNNITFCRNGSKINGGCAYNPSLTDRYGYISLIYVDATQGWLPTEFSTSSLSAASVYITATGGTITTCGDYKIHTFTADGCFSVSTGAGPLASVDYLVIGGGGSGGSGDGAGGAGAGGYRESHVVATSGCYTASPLASATSLPVSIQSYPITVGGGGSPVSFPNIGIKGSDSTFSTITSTGGGAGASSEANPVASISGGSGGGTAQGGSTTCAGAGNTPPVSPPQGNPGGLGAGPGPITTAPYAAGGGGGAGAAGQPGAVAPKAAGGAGVASSITGSPVTRAGGGGGGNDCNPGGAGGSGGGGSGGGSGPGSPGNPGTVNTGGGGGGAQSQGPNQTSGAGGSGIVIIRYKYQ